MVPLKVISLFVIMPGKQYTLIGVSKVYTGVSDRNAE
jgi:hypothetical protein